MLPGHTEFRRAGIFEMSLINKIPALHSIKYAGKSTKFSKLYQHQHWGFLRNHLLLSTAAQKPHYNVVRQQLSQRGCRNWSRIHFSAPCQGTTMKLCSPSPSRASLQPAGGASPHHTPEPWLKATSVWLSGQHILWQKHLPAPLQLLPLQRVRFSRVSHQKPPWIKTRQGNDPPRGPQETPDLGCHTKLGL